MNHNLMEARERLITAKEEYNQVMMLDWLQVTLAKYAKATDDGQKADALENAWHSLQGLKGNFESLGEKDNKHRFTMLQYVEFLFSCPMDTDTLARELTLVLRSAKGPSEIII